LREWEFRELFHRIGTAKVETEGGMGWWLELDGKDLGEGTDSMEMMELFFKLKYIFNLEVIALQLPW